MTNLYDALVVFIAIKVPMGLNTSCFSELSRAYLTTDMSMYICNTS